MTFLKVKYDISGKKDDRNWQRQNIYCSEHIAVALMHVYDKFQTAETFTVDGHKYTHTLIHIQAYITLILDDKPVN